jgi:hypothetical protein
MDEMRALHAARDALPAAPLALPAPKPAADYGRAASLFGARTAAALQRVDNGGSLYDALYPDGDPEWDAFEAQCAARAAEREANAEFYRAEEEKARLAYLQRRVVEKVVDESRRTMSRGKALQKNTCPCDRLYSCVGDKDTIGPNGRRGAQPTTKHVTSECWTHQKFLAGAVPVDCRWLHPGEPEWLPQWNTDRLWKPLPPAQHLIATALAAPEQPQKRFGALATSAAPPRAPASAPRAPASAPRAPAAAPSFPWGKK